MPKILYFILFFLSCYISSSQQKDSIINTQDEVPLAIIESAPVYPGCEKLNSSLQKECLQTQIKTFVSQNFDVSVSKGLGLDSGIIRVYVMFKIDSKGAISDIKASSTHKELENEGIRVIKSLPKMLPGKHKNKIVSVKYVLPISFILD